MTDIMTRNHQIISAEVILINGQNVPHIYWKREKSSTLQITTVTTTGHFHPDIFKMAFIIVINMRMKYLIFTVYANCLYLQKCVFAYILRRVFRVQWYV